MAEMKMLRCNDCGNEKSLIRDFYSSSSKRDKTTRRLPWCKTCVEKLYDELVVKIKDNKLAAKRLFVMLDVYYDDDLYSSCVSKSIKEDINWLGEYMRLKANAKYKEKSSLNNIDENDVIEISEVEKIDTCKNQYIDDDLLDKWGEGYTEKEYRRLEKKYNKYDKNYPSKTLQQQVIIKTICELELEKERCRISGQYNEYDKINKQISAKMLELDVIPSKQKKYGEDKNIIYGVLIKDYEENDPIPDPLPSFIDVDKFKYMLDRYFIKPFKKVFGLDKDIYTVEDENHDN